MKKILLTAIVSLIATVALYSSHFVGGNIYFTCSGTGSYKFTQVIYRDCFGSTASMPTSVTFRIYPYGGTTASTTANAPIDSSKILPVTSSDPCLTPPADLCVQVGYFTTTINVSSLSPNPGGYWVGYNSCCRNAGITNMASGSMQYYSRIPDPNTMACNNSPVFQTTPPLAMCNKVPLNFLNNAIDPDGDSLAYKLCDAIQGGPNASPPYWTSAAYTAGYSGTAPWTGTLAVNATTGRITGTPNITTAKERFVVAVCVEEWRNGVMIGEHRREFQFNVVNCDTAVKAIIPIPNNDTVIRECSDSTITFGNNSFGAKFYKWDFGTGNPGDTSDKKFPTFTFPDTGLFKVTLIANPRQYCADTTEGYVLIFPTLEVRFVAVGDSCQGAQVCYFDSTYNTHGNIIYRKWNFSGMATSSATDTCITYAAPGNYPVSLEIRTDKGCFDTLTKSTVIYPLPAVNAGQDQAVCAGDTITLNPFYSPGTLTWSPGTYLSCTTCPNPDVVPYTDITYTVTNTSAQGCPQYDSINITISTAPVIDAGPDVFLCNDSITQICGSSSQGGVPQWSPSGSVSNPQSLCTFVNPQVTTTYTLTVNGSGCPSRDTVTVYRFISSVSAGSDVSMCATDSVQLGASPNPPALAYSWTPGSTLSDPSSSSPKASPANSTNYIVTIIDTNNCKASDTVRVNVNQLPPVDAGNDFQLCAGNPAALKATGATQYVWDADPTLSCVTANCDSVAITPSATTTYYVTGLDINGCTNRDSVTVTVISQLNVSASNDTSICEGQSVPLHGTGANIYKWATSSGSTSGLSCSNCQSPTAIGFTTITYVLEGSDGFGCFAYDSTTIVVNPIPSVNAGPDEEYCEGGNAQLSATPNNLASYQWTPGTGLSNPNIYNPVASPTTTQTYILTGTTAAGCSDMDTLTVTVHPNPTVTNPGNQPLCLGDSIQLNVTTPGAATYDWNGTSAGLSCYTCAVPYAKPTTTTTYTITFTDTNTCQDVDQITVFVNNPPTITAGVDHTICENDSVRLGPPSGGIQYSWSPGNSLTCTVCPQPDAFPQTTETYVVTGFDANGCTGTDTLTVFVLPAPALNAGSDVSLCPNDSTLLQPFGPDIQTYRWNTASTGLSCYNCQDATAKPATTTTYYVIGTDSKGCENVDDVVVTMNTNPTVTFFPTSPTICDGDQVQITAGGGTGYAWDISRSGLSNYNISNPNASPSSTTMYVVQVTDANGCSSTDSLNVVVNPLPNISAGPNKEFCDGNSTTLNASGGSSYTWSPSDSLSNPNASNPVANPAVNTVYTVTGIDANGCINTDDVVVTVNALPPVDAGSDVIICDGDSTRLNGSPAGLQFYNWAPAQYLSDPSDRRPWSKPSQTVTYTLLGVDNKGCSAEDEMTIQVNTTPVLTMGADHEICAGETTALSVNTTSAVTYTWSPSSTLDDPSISAPLATPAATTTYYIFVQDAGGCTANDSMTITVNALPVITTNNDTALCYGHTIGLIASAPNAVSYLWSATTDPNTQWANNTNDTTTIHNFTEPGTVFVEVTDNKGCKNIEPINVTINPLPVLDAIDLIEVCPGELAELYVTDIYQDYLWFPAIIDSTYCTTCPSPTVKVSTQTTFTVRVTDVNGCVSLDETTVSIHPDANVYAGDNVETNKNEAVNLAASGNLINWTWGPEENISDVNSQFPIARVEDHTKIWVSGTDANGCFASDTMLIEVLFPPTVIVPTAFTPNGDGLNDQFYIADWDNFRLTEYRIYNRWGQLLFVAHRPRDGWDGTFKELNQPVGSYMYIAKGLDDEGNMIIKSGNFTLLR